MTTRRSEFQHDAGNVLVALAIFAKYGVGKLIIEDLGLSWVCDARYADGHLQHRAVYAYEDISAEDRAILERLGWLFNQASDRTGWWALSN